MKLSNVAIVGAAAAFVSTAAVASPVKPQPTKDKCFGISLAGKNDCAAGAGQTRLSGQCLEICRQGHLHRDQDAEGQRLAHAGRAVNP